MPRPLKDIDGEQVFKLAKLGCTQAEIAEHFGCAQSTISERFRLDFQLGQAQSKTSLRRAQFKSALSGCATMLIHLGKQYLGQTDRLDIQTQGQPVGGPTFNIFSNGRGPEHGSISRVHSANGTDPVSDNGS
jgi:hypothetical protein